MITVVTEPPGAAVRIDGSLRGEAPFTLPVELGRRLSIEAELEGFMPGKQTVTAEGKAQTVTITLAAPPVTTSVDAAVPAPQDAAKRSRRDGKTRKPSREPPRSAGSGAGFDRNDVSGD